MSKLSLIKYLGLKYSTNIGISLGIEDLKVPPSKNEVFCETSRNIEEVDLIFEKGNLTHQRRTQKITQIWNNTNEILKNEIITNYRQIDLLNPLYMMILSGARGNISQIKQLVGMRGIMADSQGEMINLSITSNFKEGLSIIEHFIS